MNASIGEAFRRIPDLEVNHFPTAQKIQALKGISPDFVMAVIRGVEKSAPLGAMSGLDPNDAREIIQYENAFQPMVDRLHLLAADLQFSINVKKARLNARALQAYGIAKQAIKQESGVALAPHVELMRKLLNRRNKKR